MRLIKTRKIAKEVVLPSSYLMINNVSCVKLLLEGLIMLFKPPNSLTTSSPTLSPPKQSEMYLGFGMGFRASATITKAKKSPQ